MKTHRKLIKKKIAVMFMAALLMINMILTNFMVIINAEESEKTATYETTSAEIVANEIDMGDYSDTMTVGEKQLLSVTVLPLDATNQTVTYSSSNTEVATVNGLGRISAVSVGTTTITANCNGITSSINITVVEKKDDKVEVTNIEISNHEDEVNVDETISLSATVLPSDATDSTVTYTSSNENIATVNSSGEVKGISVGTVTIAIKAGKITKNETIKVVVSTKSIIMNNDYLILKPGEEFTLSGVVFPSDAPQTLSYKSTNTKIATVSAGGCVTAVAVGNATIIVSNGDYQAAVSVIVNTSNKTTDVNEENEELDDVSKSEISYDNTVNASDVTKIDTNMLKYFYDKKTKLLVVGDGYSILLDGKDIVNYQNELITDIELSSEANSKGIKEISFVINKGNPLCGDITLCMDNAKGKYIYLYNESKEKYEMIAMSSLSEINISTPGKYLITESKIQTGYGSTLIILIIGGVLLIIGVAVYICLKKQYWFW